MHYFTVNGVGEFYLTAQSGIPPIEQLLAAGHSASASLFAVLIGPVRRPPLWIVVVAVSAILFPGIAKAESGGTRWRRPAAGLPGRGRVIKALVGTLTPGLVPARA